MRIYTKTGDTGETGLFAGPRVPKDHPRIEACGAVDELNAILGLARTEPLPSDLDGLLSEVQHALFAVGAELATPDPAAQGTRWIGSDQIRTMEQAIDRHEQELVPLREFILPSGNRSATLLHLGRAVCRRAERRLVTLARAPGVAISPDLMVYLNRLGDLLFVLGRVANVRAGQHEAPWRKPTQRD